MAAGIDAAVYPEHLRVQIDAYLADLRFTAEPAAAGLQEAMRYSLLAGGKRIRPVLVLASAEAIGLPPAGGLRLAGAPGPFPPIRPFPTDLPPLVAAVRRRDRPPGHRAS